MLDGTGRSIDYVRVSVTDRCDLRCVYCMPPDGVPPRPHVEILTYEEIVRIVGLLARLGIKKVRITGGEPLVRRDLPALIGKIKPIEGIEKVCLTTNGSFLSEQLPELVSAGLDSINISIDAIDEDVFRKITLKNGVDRVLKSIDDALDCGIDVKLNCVPFDANRSQIIPMAERFLSDGRLSLRFIEMMPIGAGKGFQGIYEDELKKMLENRFGAMKTAVSGDMSGPCRYYKFDSLPGKVGFISPVSNCFCGGCNRVRLTSAGFLKTCLQFNKGAPLKHLLRESDEKILDAIKGAIQDKPERHLFTAPGGKNLEERAMSQIGG